MVEDLYAQWLSIPAGARPPDHYVLLGLPRFEEDMAAIERAARSQLARLDKYAIHPEPMKRDACHRMMNEVARARIVLVTSERKRNYDIDLKSQGGSAPQPAKESMPRAGNGTAEPEQDSKWVAAAPRRLAAMIAGWDRQLWIYVGLVAAVIVGVALIGYRLMSATHPAAQPIVMNRGPTQPINTLHVMPTSIPATQPGHLPAIVDAPSNSLKPIGLGLAFLGRFERGSLVKLGDFLVLKDASPDANNALVNGCKIVPGRGRDAMEFNGHGDFIDLTDSKMRITATAPRTIVAWVKATTTPDYNGSIFSLGNGGRDNSFDFMVSREGMVRVDKTSGGGIPLDIRDKWHFVADTYDGEQNTIFVDDRVTFISTPQHFDNAASHVYIGKFSFHGFGMYYAGLIDELAVWKRSLSQEEVRWLYTSTADGKSLSAINWSAPAATAVATHPTVSVPAAIPVAVPTVTLTLKANIDGSDFVAINASGATWTHRTWSWPTDVTLNGVPWNPEAQSALDSTGALAFLKDVDFSTASVVGRSGRDTVAMEKTNDGISVYFADPDNGSDSYEITITLRYR